MTATGIPKAACVDCGTSWGQIAVSGGVARCLDCQIGRSQRNGAAEVAAIGRFDRFGRNGASSLEHAQNGFGRFDRFGRVSDFPAPAARDAFHGLAGDFVGLVAPHSEADDHALLMQFLVGFGNVVGRGPGFVAEGDFHATNLFVVIVGATSKGRKGTSMGRVRQLFRQVDPEWESQRIASGLASGEGLLWQVRDPIVERRKARKNEHADEDGYVEEMTDFGVTDKRLLISEGEFAQALRVMKREGNTLSVALRNLWDRGDQGSLTKTTPARTTGALVSVIGHIVSDELRRELTATDGRTVSPTGSFSSHPDAPSCCRTAALLPTLTSPRSRSSSRRWQRKPGAGAS